MWHANLIYETAEGVLNLGGRTRRPRSGLTVKLMKLKFLGPSLARAPSKALREALNKYLLYFLISYS